MFIVMQVLLFKRGLMTDLSLSLCLPCQCRHDVILTTSRHTTELLVRSSVHLVYLHEQGGGLATQNAGLVLWFLLCRKPIARGTCQYFTHATLIFVLLLSNTPSPVFAENDSITYSVCKSFVLCVYFQLMSVSNSANRFSRCFQELATPACYIHPFPFFFQTPQRFQCRHH